jgi:uncharacterized membrane protein
MFELFFKYPASLFSKGQIVFLASWPLWLLGIGVLLAAGALAWSIWRSRSDGMSLGRRATIWGLQAALVAVLLVMLWQPALSVSTLKPQQNVVAVVVDDSRSMAIADDGTSRKDRAVRALNSGVLDDLKKRFQVRLYRAGTTLERIDKPDQLTAAAPSTHLGDTLKEVVTESASLPVGAVILLTDGADNSGGIDLETLNEIRRQRIPIHTVGFGREQLAHDLEIDDVQLPTRTLAESRVSAVVSFHESGYAGQKVHLTLKDGNRLLASSDVAIRSDGAEQNEILSFNAGPAGARNVQASIAPLANEENVNNNTMARLISVDAERPKILYLEGEPRWEFKFLRRAIDEDKVLLMASILRTTQNKIYVQGRSSDKELRDGFPSTVEELFGYQGIIIGSVEAGYFTPTQQDLIKQFVDRRGGGLLFLGGRFALSEGGVGKSPLADLLPSVLPDRKDTFRRDPANVELTTAGRDSLITRLEDNPDRNAERWKKMPYLANFQDVGTPKPGAVVLIDMLPGNGRLRLPLLTTENYGRGRTAIFASAGSWRWQMLQPLGDTSHEMFWQQMLRWLVTGTHGHLIASTPKSVFNDETKVRLRAEVRDKAYLPSADVKVEAHILTPSGASETVELRPEPSTEGVYSAEWAAQKPGAYVAEVTATRGAEDAGRDVITFRREDGVAENFHVNQNRELLEKLSEQTGGRYYTPGQISRLNDEITYSEAGITTRETRDLWNMPVLFLLILLLRGAEWLLRRKWGAV